MILSLMAQDFWFFCLNWNWRIGRGILNSCVFVFSFVLFLAKKIFETGLLRKQNNTQKRDEWSACINISKLGYKYTPEKHGRNKKIKKIQKKLKKGNKVHTEEGPPTAGLFWFGIKSKWPHKRERETCCSMIHRIWKALVSQTVRPMCGLLCFQYISSGKHEISCVHLKCTVIFLYTPKASSFQQVLKASSISRKHRSPGFIHMVT